MTAQHRLLLSARCLTAGGAFLAAAAAFHFFAAHHIAPILRRAVDAKTFAFLEPIVFVHISVERRPAPAPLVHREKSDKGRSRITVVLCTRPPLCILRRLPKSLTARSVER